MEISKFIGDVSDDAKLLQFLRGCKFSLERTKEKLDLYNSCRWKVTLSLSIVEKKKVLWSCTLSLSFPSEQAFLTGSSRGTRQRRSSRRFSASGKSKAVFFYSTEKGAKLFLAQKYFLADGELDFTLMKVNCLLSQALSATSWLWHPWKAGGPFKRLSLYHQYCSSLNNPILFLTNTRAFSLELFLVFFSGYSSENRKLESQQDKFGGGSLQPKIFFVECLKTNCYSE